MALVDNTKLLALAKDIIDNVGYMTTAQKSASYAPMQAYLTKIMSYVTGNAEVSLNNSGRAIEVFTAGSGSNGGALASATGGPVSGTVRDAKAATGIVV